MIKCPECGKNIENGLNECPECGCPIECSVSSEKIIEDIQECRNVKGHPDLRNSEIKEEKSIKKEKKNIFMIAFGGLVLCLLVIVVVFSGKNKKLQDLISEYENELGITATNRDELSAKLEELNGNYEKIQSEYEELLNKYDGLKKEYNEYKEEMRPFEEMEQAEAEARKKKAAEEEKELENQKIATEAVRKIWDFENGTLASGATRELYNDALQKVNSLTSESKKAELMQAVEAANATFSAQEQAAAIEEAQGYETGISYDQLARTPDDYEGKKVKFYGKVVQVMENDGYVHIRLAVNDDYNRILYCEYDTDIVSSRILEDDHITIYGQSYGLYSYQSTMGAKITIPAVAVDRIDQ